jgi:hypothetical protein
MTQLSQAQKKQLKAIMKEFKRLKARLQAIHDATGYEDLGRTINVRWKKLSNTQTGWRDSQEIKLGGI